MSSYAKIRDFGPNTVPVNYLSVCLDNTIDGSFLMGPAASMYNSRTPECQSLLSSYIAEQSKKSRHFDNVSLAAINLQGQGFPNQLQSCSNGLCQTGEINNQSYGTQLLNNAGRMKYCAYDNGKIEMIPFEFSNPSSPLIPKLVGSNIKSICSVDPNTVDECPIMNEMLKNPSQHTNFLNNVRMNTPGLQGTKLGNFYNVNANYFANLSRLQ